jgi:BCD family chlorophyll transporter-like MFS transporter
MWRKRLQLGLIHTALAITLVPFTSTLNRVMIHELGFSATLVTVLVALPYFFSPIQVAIGSYADRHPIGGRRRTPYIVLGLLMCVGGAFVAPGAAFALVGGGLPALALSGAAFGAWGMGYNFAAVSYFSLASELDEKGRSRTIATMFFMMVVGIILTAITVGHLVDPYTPDALVRAFWLVGGAALAIGVIGLIGLEPRFDARTAVTEERHTWADMTRAILDNPQARLFFWYMIVLLAAILGQDVLLEPYGGQAFGLSPAATTRITAIWGTCMLITLVLAGALQSRFSKEGVARGGAWGALIGFALIALSGPVASMGVFYGGVVLLGLGTGLSTVSNLSLMLDMTTAENVGLFIGAWGMASAVARLLGQLLSGVVRDGVTALAASPVTGYVVVFVIEALFLVVSLVMLRRIDVQTFQTRAGQPATLVERAALMGETGD